MRVVLYISLVSLLLASCDPGEIAIDPYERGEATLNQIDLGPAYQLQAYFDFGTNSFVKSNFRQDWELAFNCSDTSLDVYLNSSMLMRGALIDATDFSFEPNPDNITMRADHPGLHKDSLGLSHIVNSEKLGIIDLGIDAEGTPRGYKKLMITFNEAQQHYVLKYANLDGSDQVVLNVPKDKDYNTVEVNLSIGEPFHMSPARHDYDVYFGQYTHQFYVPYMPYLVMGVLSNPYQTTVAIDTEHDFATIDRNTISEFTFSTARDAIGYNWKYYDLDEGVYIIRKGINYIIKDAEGFYYKMHFIDFYNEAGVKGAPKFEFQRL